jgi:S-(hydroxymethyl)glutathione dehydrogenase/alcohol dehydrogenase
MKAAILTAIGAPLTIGQVGLPEPEYGQVRVKVLVSGFCGAQLQEIDGLKGDPKHLPHLLGHEGCGLVEDVGPGVTTVKFGDKVVMHWRKGEGIESEFPAYHYKDREMTSGRVTTFSEQAIVSENRVTAVPKDTPEELCALFGCGLSTALGTIESEAEVKFGEKVLIVGCGGLGMNLLLAAKLAQASVIGAIDVHESKRAAAFEMGATHFWMAHAGTGHGLTSLFKWDVIIDTSGSAQALEWTIPLLAPSGRYVMIGQPKRDQSVSLENAQHFFEGEGKSLRATQGGRFSPARDIPRYVALYQAKLLQYAGIVSHRISLDGINEGIDAVRKGLAGRIMIYPGGEWKS